MAKSSEDLVLESRYIHTGNSGVTISVERDAKKPTRAIVRVENGAMGAFNTNMEIRGNDSRGFDANQLRDLALIFLEGAASLDKIAHAGGEPEYIDDTPHILPREGTKQRCAISPNLRNHLIAKLKASGMDQWEAYSEADKMIEMRYEAWGGGHSEEGETVMDHEGNSMSEAVFQEKAKKHKPKLELDRTALVIDRLKFLTSKL